MPRMSQSLPFFIGLRYVRSKQSEGFFSIVSGFSFGAMVLGIMALIIVLSVMNGFDREIKSRVLNVVPHITLSETAGAAVWDRVAADIRRHPGVTGAVPYAEGQGMLSTDDDLTGVSLQGVNPAADPALAILEDHMLAGSIHRLAAGDYGVVLGSLLARRLNVMTGDTLMVTLPDLTVTPVGAFPRVKRLTVVGVYEVGAQVDTGIAFLHLADLQKLLRLGDRVQGVRVTVDNPFNAREVATALAADAPAGASVRSWQETLGSLFQAIQMEKIVVGLLLAVIVAVAAFNIVASLVLMVADKRKDIAVLRAMGATGKTIAAIFRVQGAAVGLSGVAVGTVLGSLTAWQLGAIVATLEDWFGFRLFDPDVYFISMLPTDVQWPDVAVISGLGVVISLLATLYPARRAAMISPAEVLRYDH